jgi:transcriptional regulator GlxA family with amidase domain
LTGSAPWVGGLPLRPSVPPPWRVELLLWTGVELLDFAGPAQVLQVARMANGEPAFRLRTLAPAGAEVTSQGFLRVRADGILDAAGTSPDLLVIPGGETDAALREAEFIEGLGHGARRAGHVLSVCTGALLLAHVGLLADRPATTWHGAFERLRAVEPRVQLLPDFRWVSQGRVTTAAGVSAGIDVALALVEGWLGRPEAERVAHYMEYPLPSSRSASDTTRSLP